jgi:hypothetical protein
MLMMDPDDAPADLAGKRLFETIDRCLARFNGPGLPGMRQLEALLDEFAPNACSGSGAPIRFTLPNSDTPAYEMQIFNTGKVPTRANDWHDFFNALAWCMWPQAKAACNTRHRAEIEARDTDRLSGRGACRDALTQFDECGVVVVSTDPTIPALLKAHEWETVFWRRRSQLNETTRFLVFGHAAWDQLRQPFLGLCGKAIYRVVDEAWLDLAQPAQQAECDAWLAAQLRNAAFIRNPRDLAPLPLLGIPGVTADNERPDYYRDVRQFRPLRT